MEQFEAAPKEITELPATFFVGEPQLFGDPIASEEELRFYVDVYERTGFTGGLNWYRALRKSYEEAQGLDYVIDKPALMLIAEDDWGFPRGAAEAMPDLLPQLEMHVIPDACHWLQQEKPEEVNAILVPWLSKHFG